jgi:predicted  nucleic acid-binding Zn-ribbon protein
MPSLDDLRKLAYNVHADEHKLAQLEHDLYQLKLRLARARDDLDRETSLVSLAAYNDGRIDGKNETMRKLQLDAVLSEAKSVQELRKTVAGLEDNVARLELQVGYQRAQARYSRNLFDAALAAMRVASVPTVQLTADTEAA